MAPAHQDGLFAEGRYREKTGAVASPGPKRPATAWLRRKDSAAPSPQMYPSPGVNRYCRKPESASGKHPMARYHPGGHT